MPKPEPRPLRTLPERAFHARARLVAALMCCVCFAGLAARLAYLQLFSGVLLFQLRLTAFCHR